MRRDFAVIGVVVFLLVFGAAGAQAQVLFGGNVDRIELVKDVSSLEREIGFAVPGASGIVTPLPSLQVVNVKITGNTGYNFELRYSPAATGTRTFDLGSLDQPARDAYMDIAHGAGVLANLMADAPDFAPFSDLFRAIAEHRSPVTARRDRNLLTISRYEEDEREHACQITDVDLGERNLSLKQNPLKPEEFEITWDVLPGRAARARVVDQPMGVVAYVESPGLPSDMDAESLLSGLATYINQLLPVLTVASYNNEKVAAIHDDFAYCGALVRAISFVQRGTSDMPEHRLYEPESNYTSVLEPAPGYTAYLREEKVTRRIYYFRTIKVNGFITEDSYPNYTHTVITATRELFDPNPADTDKLPMPDFIWETTYPRLVNEPHWSDYCRLCGGEMDLTDRDLFYYRETAGLFDRALDDQAFRDSIPGDMIRCLRKFNAMSGQFRTEETVTPLISLSYSEVQGLANVSVLKYRDASYIYQLTMPPKRNYVSFSFSFEEALAPEIYRFFVVPTGDKAQLVISYPVDLPLGRATRRFNRSASALVRLRDLTTYLARHESVLSGVPPIINEIWRQRELIGPKMFIRPSRTGMYTDWLTADVLGSGAE
ncbi:hypothetical protein J7J84_06665 [bacterium]|nr:hypothetical protein [bacterium]